MSRINKKLSSQIVQQLPEFIRNDYETFVKFLKAYYEFIEQDQGAQEVLQNAKSYHDIDSTIDLFVDQFIKELGFNIPSNIIADKRLVFKHIRDLYKHKGTEKAYELLFRILFNEKIEFFYPYSVVLKASDGKWTQDITLRTEQLTGNPFMLEGVKIVGLTSGASAVVERVINFQNGSSSVYELFLNRSTVSGAFLPSETVRGTKLLDPALGTTLTVNVSPISIISSVTIRNGGTGYSEGDIINITGDGVGARVEVEVVDDITGAIKKIKTVDFGSGYTTAILDASLAGDGNAVLLPVIGAQCNYSGYWTGNDGKLDENIVLEGRTGNASETDPVYYQPFSYVIKTSQAINLWRDAVKKVLHPAGMALFGEISLDTSLQNVIKLPVNVNAGAFVTSEKIAKEIVEVIIELFINMSMNYVDSDVTREKQYFIRIDPNISLVNVGPRYRNLERYKYSWATDPYDPNVLPVDTLLNDIKDLVIDKVVNHPDELFFIPPPSVVNLTA